MRRVVLAVSLSLALAGCPGGTSPADAGPPDATTSGDDDAAMPIDAAVPDDAQPPIDASDPDGGAPTGSAAAPPAEIVRTGTGGFLLRGTVLAPDGPIVDGEVLIVGDSITCVAEDCSASPSADTVMIIDTHATISAGLIDAHNHATYDFLPEWVPADMRLFGNRYEWRADADYRAHVEPEARLESWGSGDPRNRQHMCAALRYAELRSVIHGTTTMMGQAPNRECAQGLVRSAEHAHGLGTNRMRTTISGACESALNDTARTSIVNAFRSGETTRHAVHMGEGYTGGGVATDPTRELDCYAGRHRYTTSLLSDTDGTPFGAALFIHAVPFDDDDLVEAMGAGAHFVWSPSSNILLYGRTAPIGRMLELGLPVALGPDWTVSGSDELLSEMRFALDWAAAEGVSQVTPESLVEMATIGGADAVDLDASIGRLAPDLRADVVVFGRVASSDPYLAVTDSRAADVRLVMIDGRAYYGDLPLEGATAFNGSCDTVDACGTSKFLCAAGTTDAATPGAETVDEIEALLRNYLETGWLEDPDGSGPLAPEPRAFVLDGDDLAPLIDCSL